MLMMELGHRQRMGSDIAIRLMHLARATPPATPGGPKYGRSICSGIQMRFNHTTR
jgi:hypothetical protein